MNRKLDAFNTINPGQSLCTSPIVVLLVQVIPSSQLTINFAAAPFIQLCFCVSSSVMKLTHNTPPTLTICGAPALLSVPVGEYTFFRSPHVFPPSVLVTELMVYSLFCLVSKTARRFPREVEATPTIPSRTPLRSPP